MTPHHALCFLAAQGQIFYLLCRGRYSIISPPFSLEQITRSADVNESNFDLRMWDRRPLRSKLIVTLAAPPSRTVPSPSWPSHSLALGNLPAGFCISAQDTSLHLCSARRNIVSVRVMNGFTCLIDFDRKKFDVKVVVNREDRCYHLMSAIEGRSQHYWWLQISSWQSVVIISTSHRHCVHNAAGQHQHRTSGCSTTQCRVERWTINCKTTWQQMAAVEPSL